MFINVVMGFKGEYEFLSNFYICKVPCLFGYGHIIAASSEHAYQAAKTENEDEMFEILNAKTPGKAKRLGKVATLRPDWYKIKKDVMYQTQRRKYNFNFDLKEKLLKTNDMDLVELNNWNDTYWGVCNGEGENHLGRILMNLRQAYLLGFE